MGSSPWGHKESDTPEHACTALLQKQKPKALTKMVEKSDSASRTQESVQQTVQDSNVKQILKFSSIMCTQIVFPEVTFGVFHFNS